MPSLEKVRAALAANPLPPSPWVEVGEEAIIIKAGFSEQLLQLLRWVPKVEWRPDKRYWKVPLTGAETVRSLLPEITRLAELTQPGAGRPSEGQADGAPSPPELFKAAARLLFGADWQRETANALGRNETELVRWLLGESALEDGGKLLEDMFGLKRRPATEIAAEADRFAQAIENMTSL